MTLVVPFDGSQLSETALVRATEFGNVFDEIVLAVSVIPKGNTKYARERGWIGSKDDFEMETVVSRLHTQVTSLCPSANFRHTVVDRYAPSGSIAKQLRRVARIEDASMVFIGSENAGQFVSAVSSVGGNVATDTGYDVVIVRHHRPAKIKKLRTASTQSVKSDFYHPR
ncbi:universal stress protein [Natronolimnobius baerhuensis]|uniref:Universal stress protein n=1 Tax=Natronolimnobius baerhuensis TaxID=253108 RepID=A0A202E464_9EURY|nr:universal stress protein [Natronolimnobius baerhuensis]OVE83083.1 universal stress protein [Natronolimnobius baerhuensis]